jgi:4-hydroxybenzoate polyprenyltransferase
VVAYDTVYAMVDRNDDLQIGVKSSAILFGRYDRVATGAPQFLFIVQMALLGVQQALGGWYFIALIGAAVLFAYQQWLIRDRDRHECLQAFLNNHYVGLLLFAGIALDFYRR